MSAAIARRRKQLAARAANGADAVANKLAKLLEGANDEPTAYEGLQLAQSQVRKAVKTGNFKEATDLGYTASLTLLQKGKVSVASQLLHVLVDVLRETHTEATDDWIARLLELHTAYQAALLPAGTAADDDTEQVRLLRLEREWLRKCVSWSNELGTIRFGNPKLLEALGQQCWILPAHEDDEEDSRANIMADAVQAMVMAEQPLKILEWLKTMDKPTKKEYALNHTCPPADRDALFTRAIILFCALENLRDALILFRAYEKDVEERTTADLMKSYMKKDDGQAPSHLIFCSMLLSVCQKDARTGPLFTWLMRSFKKELDGLAKQQLVSGYTTKIGKVYFNIQPPPSMMSMMENMMGMMGGGGGGMNPAMMQAALAQAGGM